MSIREHEYEPVRGLPERLPPGERILWQGAPCWRLLARKAFHVRKIAAYFAALLAWRTAVVISDGEPLAGIAEAAMWLVPMGALVVGFFTLMAWANARLTIYTITNRRVVMKFGVALPMTINLPFKVVHDAYLKPHPGGKGDIALHLEGQHRVAYLHLWPNVRRWHFANPQPMLRAIPDAANVAKILAGALQAVDRTAASVQPTAQPQGQLAAAS